MALSRGKKQALGICTIVSFVLGNIAALVMFMAFGRLFNDAVATNEAPVFGTSLLVFMVLVVALSMLHMALLAIYIYLVTKLDVDSTERIIWILVVVLGGAVGEAVLFFMRIWPEPSASTLGVAPTGGPVVQPTNITGWPTGES